MKFVNRRMRRPLFKELRGDQYGIKRIKHGSFHTFVDIGANVGLISLQAKLLHMPSHVFAFEPHPVTFQCLKANVAGMVITPAREALGSGEIVIMTNTRYNTDNTTIEMAEMVPGALKTKQLHELVIEYGIIVDHGTVIKIDCEGGEWSLRNPRDVSVMKKAGMITMEIHPHEHRVLGPVHEYIKWLKKEFTTFKIISNVKGQGHVIMINDGFNWREEL